MKRLILLLSCLLLIISVCGTANADTLFWDDIYNGTYTYDGTTKEMVIDVYTQYTPYYSGSGSFSSGGSGTEIHWVITADLSSFEGDWFETWGVSAFRVGDLDYFSYVNTGVNSSGQSVGEFESSWSSVIASNVGDLNPPGPWYAMGELTRTSYSNVGGYHSTGTITGAIGNAPVPEPATMMLFGIGLLGLAGVSRRKK